MATENSELLLQENALLSERLAALEFALESLDWRLLTTQAEQEFSRQGLQAIAELARVFYLKNPLIKRGVQVQRLYVWAQGWSVRAKEPEINAVLQAFLDDPKNQAELTGHQAKMQKETELQTDGNLFLVFFVKPESGRVQVRSLAFDEVQEVICNPEDAKEPWYYKRVWTQQKLGASGATEWVQATACYPDWRYNPLVRPGSMAGCPVRWGEPVFHIKTGGFSNWKFGCSEIYAAIDWAKAYKEFMEDWASIVRAYRKFAFQLTTTGGKSGIAAAKSKLSSTLGSSSESNPAPVSGSIFIAGDGANLQPVRTSGATVSAEDGRRLLLMVAAAVGLPETFFGDVSVGTLATANSLDRPTELAMRDRQTLWADIYGQIFNFVLLQAVKAPLGLLRGLGTVVPELEDGLVSELVEWDAEIDPHIDIDFPSIVNSSRKDDVAAVVQAATLDGKPLGGTLDVKTVTRMLLSALGEDDIDEIMGDLFPDGTPAGSTRPGSISSPVGTPGERPQAEALMVAAVRELRDSLMRLQENDKWLL